MRLFQSPMRSVNTPVAFGDKLSNLALVVMLEAPLAFLSVGGVRVFLAQIWEVLLFADTEVLPRVGEEVVRTAATEIGAANLGVVDGELLRCGAGEGSVCVAHELRERLALLGGHGGRGVAIYRCYSNGG